MNHLVQPDELIPGHGALFNDPFQDFLSVDNQISLQPSTNVSDTSGALTYPTDVPFLADNNGLTQRPAAPAKSRDPFLYASRVLWDAFQRTPYPSITDLEELAAKAELDTLQVSLWFDGENESRASYHPPTPDRTRFYSLPDSSPSVQSSQYPDRFLHATEVLRDAFLREPNPSKKEMWDTSAEAGLYHYQVISWFRSARNSREKTSARARITPELTRSIPPPTLTLNPESTQNRVPTSSRSSIQPTTESFAPGNGQKRKSRNRMNHPSKRKWQTNPSNTTSTLDTNSSQDSSNSGASAERQYPCLSCHEVFCKPEDWRYHQEESHFPELRWVCGKSHPRLSSVHPFNRKDNFRTHLRSHYHNINEAQELERAVLNGTVDCTGLFHDKCGFCSQDLDSRDASLEHILADIEKGYQLSDWKHQCTSLDHDIEKHVRLRLGRQDSELDSDRFHDNDNDHRDFDGFNPDGGNDPGDGGDSFGSHDGQDNGDGNSYGGSGGGSSYQAMGYMRIAKGVAERECERVRLASSPDPSERTTSLIDGQHSFKILRTLGRGGSAEVFEASCPSWKQSFAMKVIRRKQLGLSDSPERRAFNNEVQIMRSLRHPHIVEFLGSRIQADRFSLMSPVADMDLAEYLTTTREASLANAAPIDSLSLSRFFSSLAEALAVVHSSGWIHGDIKPSNILIFNNEPGDFIAKLSDFGCATSRPHHEEQIKMTPKYASPETTFHRRKRYAADIFSLGCVFLEVIITLSSKSWSEFERFCFADGDKSFHKNLGKIDQWINMMDKEQEHKACPDKAHSVPFDIIRKMLSQDPENRPTAREVLLRLPACTCCSECRAANYQSPCGQEKEDGGGIHPNQDWGPRGNASQIVDASAERCVLLCATLPKDRDAAFSSTEHTLPSMCSSPRLESISTSLDRPKGSTTLGGLKSWSALYEPPHEAVADIVVIHGLSPYPGDIWAGNDGKVQWLQDMVPKIPEARILTFRYNANMVWSDSSGLTTEVARDLLERLAYNRKDFPERPIVFVADKLGDTIVKKMLSLAKCDREYSGIYHATRGVVFLDTEQDSRSRRLDEEMLSRLAPDIECYNDSMSAAPMIVDVFKDNSTSTTSDEPTCVETESIAKDHQCSTSTQPPSPMASACTDMQESTSSEATSGSSRVGPSTIYTTDPERIAIWSSAIESFYRSVLMDIENSKRGLGASEMVTSASAITCN